jgi:AcrR family transcriptional regulator
MPKLWTDTIEAHRQSVHDAVLDAAAGLVATHGLASVTMSAIATETGIGRATLYKYFPGVDAILAAWHERHVARHLEHLAQIAHRVADPAARLRAVLEALAQMSAHEQGPLSVSLHAGDHVARARTHLRGYVGTLIADAARVGIVRADVPADELAAYCLAALGGAGASKNKAAMGRLVEVVWSGLGPTKSSRA